MIMYKGRFYVFLCGDFNDHVHGVLYNKSVVSFRHYVIIDCLSISFSYYVYLPRAESNGMILQIKGKEDVRIILD